MQVYQKSIDYYNLYEKSKITLFSLLRNDSHTSNDRVNPNPDINRTNREDKGEGNCTVRRQERHKRNQGDGNAKGPNPIRSGRRSKRIR